MNRLISLKSGLLCACDLYRKPLVNNLVKRFRSREPSPCDVFSADKKPCFDIRNVVLERGNVSHAKMIKSFLYTHFWPREPTVTGLWLGLDSQYLEILTNKYAYSGDRLLAFERLKRTGENKLVGVTISNKVTPWVADELEEWGHYTVCPAEKHRMYFYAHCIKSPNLFKKYKVPYIYEVEIIATAAEVTGQGVGALMLSRVLRDATDMRHPLVQVIAVSAYTAKICEKCEMDREWEMNYSEFVDDHGQRVFFPRRPHSTCAIYTKQFSQHEAQGFQLPPKRKK